MTGGLLMVNDQDLLNAFDDFAESSPFPHCVIDNFLKEDIANAVAKEFQPFDSNYYNGLYENKIEFKKTCNVWDKFLPNTYKLLNYLNSPSFVKVMSILTNTKLYSDPGLHGGGMHIHPSGGRLNPHLDYDLHPKLGLQRKYNLLIYLNPDWQEDWGGGLGLWNSKDKQPTTLSKTISPIFNRAVIIDTTKNSWHGLAEPVSCPTDQARQSIAVYYLTQPKNTNNTRQRALFAPTEDQKNDQEILDLIERRSTISGTHVEDWNRK
jgi:Rps23 Pro-64 3,4-dihydroxylase Tpa1-like proline 4-hydroxylase